MKCNCCGGGDLPGVRDKSGESTCFTCMAEAVAKMTSEDFEDDKMSYDDYLAFSKITVDRRVPNPIRKAIFLKIAASERLQNALSKSGTVIDYDENTENIRIRKK